MNVWAEEISLKGERWWFVPINKFAKVRIASNRVRSWFVEFGLLRMAASHLFHSYLFQCVFFTTCHIFLATIHPFFCQVIQVQELRIFIVWFNFCFYRRNIQLTFVETINDVEKCKNPGNSIEWQLQILYWQIDRATQIGFKSFIFFSSTSRSRGKAGHWLTDRLTPVLQTILMWPWWVAIHAEDFTEVTLACEDT